MIYYNSTKGQPVVPAEDTEEIIIGMSAAEANCLIEAITAANKLANSGQPVYDVDNSTDSDYQDFNKAKADITAELASVLNYAVSNT